MNRNTSQVYGRYGLVLGLVGIAYAALLVLSVVLTPASAYARECGGAEEPACCIGEREGGPCDSGLLEVFPCTGDDCGCSSTRCRAKESCGGAGERSCCLAEGLPACNGDHTEIAGTCSSADWACLCGITIAGAPIFSNGRCVPLAGCGNLGQRACCISEVGLDPPCHGDLVAVLGCVGDCTCFGGGESLHMCTNPDDPGFTAIAEPTTNATPDGPPECELAGYADLHAHLFADLGHGGGVLTGKPYDPEFGVNEALRPDFGTKLDLVTKTGAELPTDNGLACPDYLEDNGLCGDRLFHGRHLAFDDIEVGIDDTVGYGTQDRPRSNLGAPLFNGWPTWTSTTHQQMYYTWLERAYQGGLRLMVMLAVTNEALCLSNKHLRGTDCADSMKAIDAQLDEAYAFEQFIDNLNGGPGEGWFRIVTNPQEAREAISEGKLAVVLGIEVDNLFNCKEQNANRLSAPCPNMPGKTDKNGGPIDTIAKAVDYYYDKGVRHIFPIHNFDNAYGAAATWQDAIAVGNAVSEQRWWVVEDCGAGKGDYGFWIDNFLFGLMGWIGFGGNHPPVPPYPSGVPTCNQYGLNKAGSSGPDTRALGATLIKALMAKGMIIDVDHVSKKSLADILALTRAASTSRPSPYPLVATHVQAFDLHPREFEGNLGRHERMRTKEQLEKIRDDGGMIAAMLKDDVQDTGKKGKKFTNAYGSAISDDCRHSSKTFAQAYQYAVDTMDGPVALGSDFNGVAGHVGPRFGHQACGGDVVERLEQLQAGNQLVYPFTLPGFGTFSQQVTGQRTFDYNTNGLATVGQLPDLVEDLKKVGLSDTYLTALFRSAEEYIEVWEKAEGTFVETPQAKCSASSVEVAADSTCQAVVSIADGSLQDSSAVALSQQPPGPYSLGTTPVTLTVTPQESCDSPTSCTGTVRVVDQTPPPITCPANVTAECTGSSSAPVMFAAATVGADNCNSTVTSQGCSRDSGSTFSLGSLQVSCTASDSASPPNQGSCGFEVAVVDTTPPSITCPPAITAECLNGGATVTPGTATASDVCAGVTVSNQLAATFPFGMTTLPYTATDAVNLQTMCNSTVNVVDTTPPSIQCPAPETIECTDNRSASFTPKAAIAADVCATVMVSNPPTGTFPLGETTLPYSVSDAVGLGANCTSSITVVDTTPPLIASISAAPSSLWPPNHKMRAVTLSATVTDACSSSTPTCQITGISSNEPVNGLGDGDTAPDWQITGPLTATLRAERSGTGTGRIYTLQVTCTDQQGNTQGGMTTVTVPHDQGNP